VDARGAIGGVDKGGEGVERRGVGREGADEMVEDEEAGEAPALGGDDPLLPTRPGQARSPLDGNGQRDHPVLLSLFSSTFPI